MGSGAHAALSAGELRHDRRRGQRARGESGACAGGRRRPGARRPLQSGHRAMKVLQARYFDGKRSSGHEVTLMLSGARLKLVGRDVSAEHDPREVRRSPRIAGTPRWLYLPGGGACVTEDHDALDRMMRASAYERALHRWESRPAFAALAVALVVGAMWLLVERGVPAAAEAIAARIPIEAEAVLGREALAGMDSYFMKPSKLPAARQHALRTKLAG